MRFLHAPVALLLILAALPLAGALSPAAAFRPAGDAPAAEPTCREIIVPGSVTPGGVITGCVATALKACYAASGGTRWLCRVQVTLSLRVDAPLACAEAHSTGAPGTPPTILTCAGAAPSMVVRIVDQDFDATQSSSFELHNWVCARPAGECKPWSHPFEVPANPGAQAMQATVPIGNVIPPGKIITIRDGSLEGIISVEGGSTPVAAPEAPKLLYLA